MSESEVKHSPPMMVSVQGGDEKKGLKYLEFVQAAAIYMVVYSASLYDYAKQNSGPLRPGVETVEGTVKTVIGPVYEKFHDVPFVLLQFVDRKVDESIKELDRRVPSVLKHASHQLLAAAQKAPEVAREMASEVQRAGLVDAATNIGKTVYTKYEPAAKQVYFKYEPVAEQYAVSARRWLNQLPLFPQVAQIILPTAAYWCEKYHEAVAYTAEKGYKAALYLPTVPVERIGKVFQGAENGPNASPNSEPIPVSST